MRKFVNVESVFAYPDDGIRGIQDYDEQRFMKGT